MKNSSPWNNSIFKLVVVNGLTLMAIYNAASDALAFFLPIQYYLGGSIDITIGNSNAMLYLEERAFGEDLMQRITFFREEIARVDIWWAGFFKIKVFCALGTVRWNRFWQQLWFRYDVR